MRKLICILSILAITICFSKISIAQHPGTPIETEHPGKGAMLSADEIIKGIKDHIDKVTKANAGYFSINDPIEGKDLRLKLIKVHEDKVSYIKKDDAYFACVDFRTDDGKTTYDIDFWMKKGMFGKPKLSQTKIHKKDGRPRFTYQDDEIAACQQ